MKTSIAVYLCIQADTSLASVTSTLSTNGSTHCAYVQVSSYRYFTSRSLHHSLGIAAVLAIYTGMLFFWNFHVYVLYTYMHCTCREPFVTTCTLLCIIL